MSTCPECFEDTGCTCGEVKRIAELEGMLKLATTAKNVSEQHYQARVSELEADLEREQRPWSVELCYDDGDNPFSRLPLKIADVGVADHILVVTNDKVEQALWVNRDKPTYSSNKEDA